MRGGRVEERESQTQIQTYSLVTDNISALWLCGKAKIWRQPGVSSPVYANGPR